MVFTISIARIGMINELDGRVFETYSASVLDRAFVSPFDTGVLANRYAEDVGGLGVSSIRPLALAMGEEPVNLPNTVNRTYFPHLRETGMVNTSFIFDLQASFGIWEGWWISLVLLGILDHLLYLFRGGRGLLLVAFFAALMTSMISLVNSAFTTVLLSGGIMWIPLLFLACRLRPLDLEDKLGPPGGGLNMAGRGIMDLVEYGTGTSRYGARAGWSENGWFYPVDLEFTLRQAGRYYEPRDAAGLPMRNYGDAGARYSPSRVNAWALAHWNRLQNGVAESRPAFLQAADWLRASTNGRFDLRVRLGTKQGAMDLLPGPG